MITSFAWSCPLWRGDGKASVQKPGLAVLTSKLRPQYHWVASEPGTTWGWPVGSAIHHRTWPDMLDGRWWMAARAAGHRERMV